MRKGSVALYVLLGVILLAIAGLFYWQYKTNQDTRTLLEKLSQTPAPTPTATPSPSATPGAKKKLTCIDSDVNEKPDDIYIKGTVTYTTSSGEELRVSDSCSGTKLQVNELWCYESPEGTGNFVNGRMVYDCPKGCLDGACIK